MLHKASRIRGAPVHAIDGDVGHVGEFYFDDGTWTIRYLWVNTGTWLEHRPVLIPSHAIEPDWGVEGLSANLTKEQARAEPAAAKTLSSATSADDHLSGTTEIIGCHLQATDGGIGHVDDFLFDEHWSVRYLVVDTSNFIGGKSVVISPAALHGIDLSNQKMQLALTRDEVKRSPLFDSIDVAPGEGVRIWIM